jgi:hypothetical protein
MFNKNNKNILVVLFCVFVMFPSLASARLFDDDIVRGTNFGSFGDLRKTPDLDEKGEPNLDENGDVVMRDATPEDIKKQVYKKLAGKFGIRKIKGITVKEDTVLVEIVEKTGAPFYTMVLDRDAGKEATKIAFDKMMEEKDAYFEKAKSVHEQRVSFYESYLKKMAEQNK